MKTWTFKDGSTLKFTEPDGSDPFVGLPMPNALTTAITNLNDTICALVDRKSEKDGWGDPADTCDEQDAMMEAIMVLVVVIMTTNTGGCSCSTSS